MNLSKIEKENFLNAGGILLRSGNNSKGESIIKKKTLKHEWHVHVTCPSITVADSIIEKLCTNHPDQFKKDE